MTKVTSSYFHDFILFSRLHPTSTASWVTTGHPGKAAVPDTPLYYQTQSVENSGGPPGGQQLKNVMTQRLKIRKLLLRGLRITEDTCRSFYFRFRKYQGPGTIHELHDAWAVSFDTAMTQCPPSFQSAAIAENKVFQLCLSETNCDFPALPTLVKTAMGEIKRTGFRGGKELRLSGGCHGCRSNGTWHPRQVRKVPGEGFRELHEPEAQGCHVGSRGTEEGRPRSSEKPQTLPPEASLRPGRPFLMPSHPESREQPWVWAGWSRRAELTGRAKAPVTEVQLFLHGKNKWTNTNRVTMATDRSSA